MKIGKKKLGQKEKAFIVAEVGQAHDGSIGYAHSFIDIAFETGVDAIKFQAHFASEESTRDEKFRVNFSYVDKDRYDYWKRMEFSPSQLKELKEHSESLGLEFICTPFSDYAIDVLQELGIKVWKIGSGESSSSSFIEKIASTKKPIILSTGMSFLKEIDETVNFFKHKDIDFCLLQCTSKYPTPLEEIEVHSMIDFAKRYEALVGLSDHSGTIWPSLFGIVNGANLIEVHIKLDVNAFGPDSSSSLLPEQISNICEARDTFHIFKNNTNKKDTTSKELSKTRRLFSKSISLHSNFKKGTKITKKMISMRKPGTGFPESQLNKILGKKLKRDYNRDYLLKKSDIE